MMSLEQKSEQPRPPSNTSPKVQADLRIQFSELAGGRNEVQIEYRGQIYRLRVTRNGKLILNK